MQQNIRKTADNADYTIEREFLGDITVTDLIEQIIQSHLIPPYGHSAALSQTENASRFHRLNEDGNF